MSEQTAGALLAPLFHELLGNPLPVRVEFWDGSSLGSHNLPALVRINRPDALRRMLYAPNELGIGRAYVSGDIDLEGDLDATLAALWEAHPDEFRLGLTGWARAVAAAFRLGIVGRQPAPPPEEAPIGGWRSLLSAPARRRHSTRRDAAAVSHHYDVSNDFYRLVLGPAMTYSCARFAHPDDSLEVAQQAKHDLVARKLGLSTGMRLLDVGCGWGSMAIHAARMYGAEVVGITLSHAQAELARKRVAEAGLTGQVDIRIQDYRHLGSEQFDAISSIGMFEHVGHKRRDDYFAHLANALVPYGRFLNHAISTPHGASYDRHSFINRYVFPDGELQDVGETIVSAENAGLEVRDVECLREHYPLTLRGWVDNLVANWDEAVRLVGEGRARVWRIYMTGAIAAFTRNDISVHQVLHVKAGADGGAGMPLTRAGWS